MDERTVGDRIYQARKEKGYTQATLADMLGIKPQYLGDIEHGKRLLPPVRAKAVARALGLDGDELARQCLIEHDDSGVALELVAENKRLRQQLNACCIERDALRFGAFVKGDSCRDCYDTGRRASDGQPCQSCDRAWRNPVTSRPTE